MFISKPFVKLTVIIRSTTDKESDMTVMAVFPLFLPKFAQAIENTDTLPFPLFVFLDGFVTSVNLNASMGDTLEAIRPGLWQDINTVIRANTAEIININGLIDTTFTIPSRLPIMTGVITLPTAHPSISPMGMPISESRNAWRTTILFICLGVVPMVLRRP